jgi:hypothetical protein
MTKNLPTPLFKKEGKNKDLIAGSNCRVDEA